MKIRIIGTDALIEYWKERNVPSRYIWYEKHVDLGTVFEVDSEFPDPDIYVIFFEKESKYRSVMKGDAEVIDEDQLSQYPQQ